jgi:hypothetical protein
VFRSMVSVTVKDKFRATARFSVSTNTHLWIVKEQEDMPEPLGKGSELDLGLM